MGLKQRSLASLRCFFKIVYSILHCGHCLERVLSAIAERARLATVTFLWEIPQGIPARIRSHRAQCRASSSCGIELYGQGFEKNRTVMTKGYHAGLLGIAELESLCKSARSEGERLRPACFSTVFMVYA